MTFVFVGGCIAGAIVNAQRGAAPGVVIFWAMLAGGMLVATSFVTAIRHRGLVREAESRVAGHVVCVFTRGAAYGESGPDVECFDSGWVEIRDGGARIRTLDGRLDEPVLGAANGVPAATRSHFLSSFMSVASLTVRDGRGRVVELEVVRPGIQSISGPSNRYVDRVAAEISTATSVPS